MKPTESELRDLYEAQKLTSRAIAERFAVRHISVLRWMKSYGIGRRRNGRGLEHRGITGPSKEELFQMIHVEHLGYAGVAARFGVDPSAVKHWLVKYDIKPPTIWQTRSKGRQPKIDPEKVRQLYGEGFSLNSIGTMFGVSSEPIRLVCEKHDIELRPDGFDGTRYRCRNGLEVRSSYEMRTADWLTDHDVEFTYEPRYPFSRKLKADFLANGWYIEIWGVVGLPSYGEKKRRKVRLCESHGIPLIQLRHDYFNARGAHLFEERLSAVLTPASVQGALF